MFSPFRSITTRTGRSTHRHPTDAISSLVLLVVIALGDIAHKAAADDRVFVDSRGHAFTWTPTGEDVDDVKQPKIIINAKGALSLFHLGMSEVQFVGVYDSWKAVELDAISGDGTDTSNILIPSSEELTFLESAAVNLTPQCSTQTPTADSCAKGLQFNVEDLKQVEYDFIIAQGVHQRDLVPKEADLGSKIIWINERFQPDEGCYSESPEGGAIVFDETICEANSLIDSVRHLETLAAFLGIEPTSSVLQEQQAMCQTAANFVEHAQDLHQRGIYIAAGHLGPFNGGTVSVFAPSSYPWLRTLEELGLPLLHPPREQDTLSVASNYRFVDWFPDCNTDTSDEPLARCSKLTTTAIPVDFWLWWTPVYQLLQQSIENYEDIRSEFPDPALTARQYSFFISNGAVAISYTNIRRFLEAIQEATTNIVRVHSKTIECTEALIVSSAEYNTPGGDNALRENEGGAYNCFNRDHLQSLYTECPTDLDPTDAPVRPTDAPVELTEAPVQPIDGGSLELCFSGQSIVKLEDASMIRMSDLKIGDRVQVSDDGQFDTVYSFGHYQPDSIFDYLSIKSTAKAAPITISAPHMLFLEGKKAVPASAIKIGDVLLGGKIVTKVDKVSLLGAYAPFTYSGSIVVNGVVASNYVSLTGTSTFLGIDMQFIAHTTLGARRALCRLKMCEEKYSSEGIATWIPHQTAAWIAAQEVGIGFLTIAAGAIVFAHRQCQKNVM